MSVARNSSATATTGTADPARGCRGRFAPSPSGSLHFGSLVAAVGSFLDVRARGGEWLVRIEDLDPPRERPGAAEEILATLEALGLQWDGPVLRQSTRTEAYAEALRKLESDGLVGPCRCSRSQLETLPQNRERHPGDELFHPSHCLATHEGMDPAPAWRFHVPDGGIRFVDRVQGTQCVDVAATVGDFVVRRRDGWFAYQLAVVVDDAAQGITDVVRGNDLLASTARQRLLQDALGLPRPAYMHLPLAVDHSGLKLSKTEDAPALQRSAPATQVVAALEFLRQDPPGGLERAPLAEVWQWAVAHWRPQRFAGLRSATAPAPPGAQRQG